jgi:hypothetical protein
MNIPISFSYHRHSERKPDPVVVCSISSENGRFISLDIGYSISVFLTDAQLEEIRLAIVKFQDAEILAPVQGGLLTAEDLGTEAGYPARTRRDNADFSAADEVTF